MSKIETEIKVLRTTMVAGNGLVEAGKKCKTSLKDARYLASIGKAEIVEKAPAKKAKKADKEEKKED